MDNFRKRNRGERRHAVDGFLTPSPGSSDIQQPTGRRPSFDGFRSGGRRIDNFARPDGLHVTQSGSVHTTEERPIVDKKEQPARQASLLHMSLPNSGALSATKKPDKKAKRDKSNHSRWRTFRKWSLRSSLLLTALVVVIGGFLVIKGVLKINKVFKGGGSAAALQADVKPELLKGEGDGRVNILLLGKGGPGHDGADLTDTMIIASIDPVNKASVLVSIPRDLWVTVPGYGSSKINAVYANAKNRSLYSSKDKAKAEAAGAEAIKQQVGQVFGIPIHYYAMIDFTGFKQAVDVVGGVDINVPAELAVSEHLWDSTTRRPYYLNVPAGQQHFDATRALYFARSRHTSKRGDFDRAERQRLFIQALSQKVLSAGTYTNPVKISQLMSAFGDHVSTDMSVNNALRLTQIGKGMNMSKMKSIGLADPPNNYVRTDNIDGISVVRPTAGFGDYGDIQNYIRNTLKDPYLAKENAVLNVLNGTSQAGLATSKADKLKSYGYNVTKVGDAPTQDYNQTVLVDLTGGKKSFTKNYLEKRLGVKAVTRLPDKTIQAQGVDFVIILGQDE